jgi:D-alanyl-D-alanine dipeptidase
MMSSSLVDRKPAPGGRAVRTLVLSVTLASISSDPAPPIAGTTRQLVLVVTPSAGATSGTMFRFERDSEDSPWKPLGAPWAVVLGPKGLASGRGLFGEPLSGLPVKVEGDGTSPAGVFRLTEAFGFDDRPRDLHLPYVAVTGDLECVDDPRSSRYNRLVRRGDVGHPDWSSSERMREIPGYRWGVVVAHNTHPVSPGAGSCIFLHAWEGPDSVTAGCTAMPLDRIEALVRWLRSGDDPVLVQLTEALYRELRERWLLPDVLLEPSR